MIRRSLIGLLAVLAVVAAGCGDDPAEETDVGAGSGGDGAERIDERGDGSDAPTEPVLLVEVEGAFTTMEANFQNTPLLAVYADGTVIQPGPQIMIYPGPALPAVDRTEIDPAQVDEILEAVRAAGLDQGDLDYGFPPIADAGDTVVTIALDGGTVVHRANALGLEDGFLDGEDGPTDLTEEQQEARRTLSDLLAEVQAVVAEEGDEAQPFETDRYRLLVRPASEMQVDPEIDPAPPVEWTVDGVELTRSDCLPVEGEATDALVSLLSEGDLLTRYTDGGEEWVVVARPVLPHEDTCPPA